MLAVIAWGRDALPAFPAFASDNRLSAEARGRTRTLSLAGIGLSALLAIAANAWFLTHSDETFGLAGWLWLLGIALLLISTAAWPRPIPTGGITTPTQAQSTLPTRHAQSSAIITQDWTAWEIALLVGLAALALVLRVWDLDSFPNNLYPDEIMTGTVASNAYLGGSNPSIFTTLWGEIDLPALWFLLVSWSLKLGGSTLAALRLPAALFGAATILPFYGLVRASWGRTAAIAGGAIFAFSAANIHYSRQGLNNIVTPFFWAVCFFFLLRGLRTRRPLDWACAGLAAGLSEYGFYATRLLPFVLVGYLLYLLAIHRREAIRYLWHFGLLAIGYFVAFGPLLVHFAQNPGLYFGHGSSLLIWNQQPNGLAEPLAIAGALWPSLVENLLGFSTHPSQELVYFAPMLLPVEAALLVLGTALLAWRWKRPADFLVLFSGVTVLFVGGVLTRAAPSINRWVPAFPAFYIAVALPLAAWVRSTRWLGQTSRITRYALRIAYATLALALITLAWLNTDFYFRRYYADPDRLVSENYRRAQGYYEMQTAQSRYQASLGPDYVVRTVGQSTVAYDPTTTSYLVKGQDWGVVANPASELPLANVPPGKGMAFIFYPGSEQYRDVVRSTYPGGEDGEVQTPNNKLLFYTYTVRPPGHP